MDLSNYIFHHLQNQHHSLPLGHTIMNNHCSIMHIEKKKTNQNTSIITK